MSSSPPSEVTFRDPTPADDPTPEDLPDGADARTPDVLAEPQRPRQSLRQRLSAAQDNVRPWSAWTLRAKLVASMLALFTVVSLMTAVFTITALELAPHRPGRRPAPGVDLRPRDRPGSDRGRPTGRRRATRPRHRPHRRLQITTRPGASDPRRVERRPRPLDCRPPRSTVSERRHRPDEARPSTSVAPRPLPDDVQERHVLRPRHRHGHSRHARRRALDRARPTRRSVASSSSPSPASARPRARLGARHVDRAPQPRAAPAGGRHRHPGLADAAVIRQGRPRRAGRPRRHRHPHRGGSGGRRPQRDARPRRRGAQLPPPERAAGAPVRRRRLARAAHAARLHQGVRRAVPTRARGGADLGHARAWGASSRRPTG